MRIDGHTKASLATAQAATPDTARLLSLASPIEPELYVSKISVYLDSGGPGSGSQHIAGGIRCTPPVGDAVLLECQAIEIDQAAEEGWYDLILDEPYRAPAGSTWVAWVRFSEPNVARIWATTGSVEDPQGNTATGYSYADVYDDASDDWPEMGGSAPTHIDNKTPAIFLTFSELIPLPREEEAWYARLGFYSAQEALGTTGPDGKPQRAVCGWHGTSLDLEPQGGSFAIVDTNSDLVDLVGDRIQVSVGGSSVNVYVHRAMDLSEQGDGDITISLTRRAFVALAVLSTEKLNVNVVPLA